LPLLSGAFGLWEYCETSRFDRLDFLFLASSIPAFIGLRLVNYSWLFWNRLRKHKIIWGLVHTQLSVVVFVTILFALLGAAMITIDANQNFPEETLAATVAHRIVLTIIPFLAVVTVTLISALAVVLPPAALASYLFSRRMTQRLKALTQASGAIRRGDFSARVSVSGFDEVAQLQTDFNTMAGDLDINLQTCRRSVTK
jgi:methyl-accepting chemotaxis protein